MFKNRLHVTKWGIVQYVYTDKRDISVFYVQYRPLVHFIEKPKQTAVTCQNFQPVQKYVE